MKRMTNTSLTNLDPVSATALKLHRIEYAQDQQNHVLEFRGQLLGQASSESAIHRGHDPNDPATRHAAKQVKCSACRWLEIQLYRRVGDGQTDYVVHTMGASNVPGEIDYERVTETPSAFEVVEALTVRKSRGDVFMPPQHAKVLALAAEFDDGIREAYINRAVA
jgi:hypothetical protein